ncbi:MAG: EscU/YscU/HrcU family type III secretion system export apparatus switch protein [Gammaproteobacteria bacterium]|nr:EscU/YscU/HrcU family type III secretion system export apparatus switch protein [Gammaproteobacteria bacterium]
MAKDKPTPSAQTAVALRYNGDGAPRVVAKGRGASAEQIIALAAECDIPMRADPELVELLASVELDAQIPVELYIAAAEVLAFAFSVSGKDIPEPE